MDGLITFTWLLVDLLSREPPMLADRVLRSARLVSFSRPPPTEVQTSALPTRGQCPSRISCEYDRRGCRLWVFWVKPFPPPRVTRILCAAEYCDMRQVHV